MKLLIGLMVTLLSFSAFADVVKLLPANDPLRKTSRAIATQLSENNISTGRTVLWSGKLKVSGSLEDLTKKGFTDAFTEDQEMAVPKKIKSQLTFGTFFPGDSKVGSVYKMTTAVMESCDYTPTKENRDPIAAKLWVVLRKFNVSKETQIGHIQIKLPGSETELAKTIQYFLIVNPDKTAIQLYTVQGSM